MTTSAPLDAPSIDLEEIAYFDKLAHRWWDTEGPFWPLQKLNAFRVEYIRERLGETLGTDARPERTLQGLRLLDIGCGGGILSESMARLGDEFELLHRTGVRVNPLDRSFHYTGCLAVNYMMLLRKAQR